MFEPKYAKGLSSDEFPKMPGSGDLFWVIADRHKLNARPGLGFHYDLRVQRAGVTILNNNNRGDSEPSLTDTKQENEVTLAWLGNLADGKADAVGEFWERYGESLQRVAERQIASWLRRRVDPEDVVQSACRTFFRRASEGNFSLESKDDLWKLLLTITLNKVRMQARFHTRNRRSVAKERAMPEEASLQPAEWDEAIEKIELQDMLDTAFADYDDEKRELLDMWLDGRTQKEIAEKVGCSERTVRRMQDRIREDLKGFLQRDENETLS